MTTYPRVPVIRRQGFTLIELLIVVAIIAILAAIAVPNFLEAQTRSKVSRVKNDHRALATSLESYAVDYNKYPGDQDNDPFHPTERGFYKLTTPVAYMTSFPSDPFSDQRVNTENVSSIAAFYTMGCGADNNPLTSIVEQTYVLISLGPDRIDGTSGQDDFPVNTNFTVYDPTNGTVSNGDVYRFGGNYPSGNWTIEGIPYQNWAVTEVMPQ